VTKTFERRALRVIALGLGSLPGAALACPMCLAAKDDAVQMAFLLTTVLLSALPVIMIGSLIIWIARRSIEIDREDDAPPPLPAPEAPPPAQETPSENGKLIALQQR
jgi:hypothetical protein